MAIACAALACVIPWLSALGFARIERSHEAGFENAAIWQGGLPFRFLAHSELESGLTFHSHLYWCDVVFWFIVLGAGCVAFRCLRGRLQRQSDEGE
jgi:hypothetical protein